MAAASHERDRLLVFSTQIMEVAEQCADVLLGICEGKMQVVEREPDGTWPASKEALVSALQQPLQEA